MEILILGAGLQGSACAYDLLRREDVDRVVLADLDPAGVDGRLPGSDPRLDRRKADFRDDDEISALMEEADVVLSAAPYYFNRRLARLAIESRCHYADLGGNTAILREQLGMDRAAREAGCTLAPDVGLAPGMVDVLAAEGIRRLDESERVRMYVGGLPQDPKPPLGYKVVYSLEGTLDYYTTPSWILRDGSPTQVEALSEIEEVEFAELGRLEAFHTAGGASLLPWKYEGRVGELAYKTLRYPGHAEVMRAIRDLGLLSQEPVTTKSGDEVVPREVFLSCVEPRLRFPDDPDLVALRVVAEGVRSGEEVRLVWDLLDRQDPETGISAMERTTGFSLAITGLFLGRGTIERRGAFPSFEVVPYEPYVEELAARGIQVRYREESPAET